MTTKAWQIMLLGLGLACASNDAAVTPPSAPSYDRYASGMWFYHYADSGYSEGLDSVVGTLILTVAQTPGDSAAISASRDVVGYFWGKAVGAETVRGTARIWPANVISRGRWVMQDSVRFRLIEMQPSTFLNHAAAVFERTHADTVVYVLGIVGPDWSLALIVPFTRVP